MGLVFDLACVSGQLLGTNQALGQLMSSQLELSLCERSVVAAVLILDLVCVRVNFT